MTSRPPLYPAFLDIYKNPVLLVGAGKVGIRKAREFLACGAHLKVVSPIFLSDFDSLVQPFERLERPWEPGDETGARLVLAATDDPEVNRQIHQACQRQGILCNVTDVPALCDWQAGAVAREGQVQIAINTAGAAPSLSSWTRRKLTEWLNDGVVELVKIYQELRTELQDHWPLESRESFWKSLDPEELLGLLRNHGSTVCREHIRNLAKNLPNEPSHRGRVLLVGAGPGHPDLITRMGLRALGRATALVYDRLVSTELLDMVPTSCQKHPVGKTGFGKSVRQEDINAMLVELAQAGHTVVRLKGGDPFVFGRGGEEIEACEAAGIPFEVVPGLSSSLTVPAYAGIPITHRGLSRSFAIVSGFHADGSTAAIPNAETVIVMMPLHSMASVTARFLEAGWSPSTPCAAIQSGTTPQQRVLSSTLDLLDQDLRGQNFSSPLIVVVGPVAAWAKAHTGFTSRFFTAPRGSLAL